MICILIKTQIMSRLKTHQELLEEYDLNKIPYTELLNTNEWNNKRYYILSRDNFTCQTCDKTQILIRCKNKEGETICKINEIKKGAFYFICENEFYYLNVHHKYYIEGLLPWEYKDEELISYCPDCHMKWHEENKVKYYIRNKNGELIEESYQACDRCEGTGYLTSI